MTLETIKTASVETLRAFGPDSYILALGASFPCLSRKIRDIIEDRPLDRRLFDSVQFEKNSRAWSTGERHAARFLLTVWCYSDAQNKACKFDAVDALSTWDDGNRAAFIAWAASPVWP